MAGDGADPRAAMFEPNNRLAFDRPVEEAARAWWLARFFEPHGLTPEGMGLAVTRSLPQDKHVRYRFIDGPGEAFCVRVEGNFADNAELWFVERTLSLKGGAFQANEVFVASPHRRGGYGRRLMSDLIAMSERLGIDRIRVEARDIGRYAWLRMGFRPDDRSWRDMRPDLLAELFRIEAEIGSQKAEKLIRQIVMGPSDVANVLAALTDPVPSRKLYERSEPMIVPLGKALFLDAARDWDGEFDLKSAVAMTLARAYIAEGGQDG